MLPNKRKLPVLKRKRNNLDEENHKEDEYKSNEQFLKEGNQQNPVYDNRIIIENNENDDNNELNDKNKNFNLDRNNRNSNFNMPRVSEGFEIPEFLLRPENDHYFQSYMRMRQRNITDGAIVINLESDDIANNRVDLYDNKGINVALPIMNENLARNVDYFIENINRDKFVKIPKQTVMKMQRIEKIEGEKKKFKAIAHKDEKILPKLDTNVDIHRITEDEMFEIFDKKLTEMINKTANKISLLFLIIQGLLAGISLINLLLLYQYSTFSDFIKIYSFNVREIFNFTHTLTFGSLVGTGMKFLASYKKYQNGKLDFTQGKNLSYLKRTMMISASVFFIYLIAFAFLLYMAGFVPLIIYQKYSYFTMIKESQFMIYGSLNTVVNVLCILSFIIYVSDVNVDDVTVNKDDNTFNQLIEDNDETREETNPY